MARKIEVEIVADTKGFSKGLDDATSKSKKFGSSISTSLSSFAKGGAISAAVGGVALITKGLFDSVGAAKEAEASQARLESALKSAGKSYSDYGGKIDTAIKKTSDLGIDDEKLMDSFSKLVRSTGNVNKSLDGMNLAADIAAARHISLESATKTVERAMLGNENALKRVGVEIGKGMSSTQALEKAQLQFAGSAERSGATAIGAQAKLQVAFENLQEAVGKKLIPVLTDLALKLTALISWSEANWPKFQAAAEPVFNMVKTLVNNMIDRIQAIITVIQGVVKVIQGIRDGEWGKVWEGLKQVAVGAINLIVATMIALPAAILKAVTAKAFSGLSRIGEWIKDAVLSGLEGIGNGVLGLIQGAINRAIDLLNGAISAYNAIPLAPNIPKVGHVGGGGGTAPEDIRTHRAAGGPVSAGMPYIVGERGRELFVPSSSGTIVPNNKLGGGGVVNNYYFPNYVGSKQELINMLRTETNRAASRNG